MMEFALVFPVMLAIGGWGIEVSFLAFHTLKISQLALNIADSISRVGADAGGGVSQLREADVNDVFQGTRIEGKAIGIGTYGRITLSSLEFRQQSYDSKPQQRIHWQRCFGKKNGAGYDSSYGTTSLTAGTTNNPSDAGTTVPDGMGDPDNKVKAPLDNAVMFVEINYMYRPLFGGLFLNPQIIHQTASLLVRDNRDLTQIQNFSPAATRSTCNLYAA